MQNFINLFKAIEEDDRDAVKNYIAAGGNVNVIRTYDWQNALHVAAKYNRLYIAGLLLKAGCDTTVKDETDATPLELAEYLGHILTANLIGQNQVQV